MNMQKGIVFETTTAYSIFLTSDGLFEKGIPLNSNVQIGEEVYFRPYQNIKQLRMKGSYRSQWMTPILSVVATIVLLFSVLLPAQSNVSAYVQFDINPSIELGINNAGNVYSFKGMNEDGLAIKRDISFWKGKSLSWVLLQIVDRTESLIIQEETIEITTIYQNDKAHDKLEKVIETAVTTSTNQILPKKNVIKVNEATVSEWKSATSKGVSVQKHQKELNEKNNAKREKMKIKEKAKEEMKTDIQKTETRKNQSKSKVNNKEKKEPNTEKPNPQNKSMTNEKQSNKNVQEKQQNNGKKEKSKENQKVNDQPYKNEKPKEKINMKQPIKQKTKSIDAKDTKSNFNKNGNDVKGNEKKNKNVKVAKKLKTNEIKHQGKGNKAQK